MYRTVLKNGSPHIKLWSKLLPEISAWKLIDLKNGKDVTNIYPFAKNWVITIRSVIYLWEQLQKLGLHYLNLRNLNQDPLENLFCTIRQHGIQNSNPTCHQFTAALKTVVLNKLVAPVSRVANCEDDNCNNLENFEYFLRTVAVENVQFEEIETFKNIESHTPSVEWVNFEELEIGESLPLSYVSGYILKKIKLPDDNCEHCRADLFSSQQEQHHLFTMFKEHGSTDSLTYASDQVITLVQNLHVRLYRFLDANGHKLQLECAFKADFYNSYNSTFCEAHKCDRLIVDKCVTFLIFKYVKDRKKLKDKTSGYYEKMKQFKSA